MALDEALMETARAGRVTLRLYAWKPPALSLGRNQPARDRYDRETARARGIDIVRRPTGGRAVYHDRELTYSVTAPAELWGRLRDSYRRINRALEAGLARLGVATRVWDGTPGMRAPAPSVRSCFRDPLPGELATGGRKLVGSAQWRERGAFLQHGSILLHNDQQIVEELRIGRRPSPVAAASLGDTLTELPRFEEMVRALADGFETEFRLPTCAGEASASELAAAGMLETRYGSEEWTWRR